MEAITAITTMTVITAIKRFYVHLDVLELGYLNEFIRYHKVPTDPGSEFTEIAVPGDRVCMMHR